MDAAFYFAARRLSDEVARRYFGELLSAIGHCHSRGVCHRDVKVSDGRDQPCIVEVVAAVVAAAAAAAAAVVVVVVVVAVAVAVVVLVVLVVQ